MPNPARAMVAVGLLLGAGTLRAQNTLDTTLTVHGTPRLSVTNVAGEVTVRSWNRSQIRIQAEYDRARIEIDERANRVAVRTVARRGDGEADYTITVPSGTGVEVSSVAADVDIREVCGDLSINTVSGDVIVECAEGEAVIQSVSGDLEITNVRGAIDASATSGDVIVRRVRGPVKAGSVSGDIVLEEIDGADVEATTISGEVLYIGRILEAGRYKFEAHSGDVSIRVLGPLNATVTVNTFSGEFESDFPIELVPGAPIRREWQFRLGNGGARVRLQSFSGTVQLRRGAGREE